MAEKICKKIDDLVGNTPLLELGNIERKFSLGARLLAKLEYLNPAGSVKDRAALAMLDDAEQRGLLKKGGAVIEPTSGNTGIGLAAIAAARNYRLIVVMPENMSVERQRQIGAYGAEVVLTPAASGMGGAIARAEELAGEIPGSFLAGQFVNPANPEAHYHGTGPEIWRDTDGKIDIFVAGVGSGGTITGVGKYLKERKPQVEVVAVEPAASPILSGGKPGAHKIQGIGAGFVPKILNDRIYDSVMAVADADAFATARLLARQEGVLCGISSGAALWAAMRLAENPENAGKSIVVLLPDSGDRYLSLNVFEN